MEPKPGRGEDADRFFKRVSKSTDDAEDKGLLEQDPEIASGMVDFNKALDHFKKVLGNTPPPDTAERVNPKKTAGKRGRPPKNPPSPRS